LLEERLIDQYTLDHSLREQVERKVLWMFTLPPDTAYGYYAGVDYLERWGGAGTPVEPLALIWRGIRAYGSRSRIEAALERFRGSELRLHPDAQPARFRFAQREQAVVDVLRVRPHLLEPLSSSGLEDRAIIERMVYTLALTRHLDVGTMPLGIEGPVSRQPRVDRLTTPSWAQGPPFQVPSAPPAPMASQVQPARLRTPAEPPRFRTPAEPPRFRTPADPSDHSGEQRVRGASDVPASPADPAIEAFKEEIRTRGEQLGRSYYEILGVPLDAPTSVIQGAFFQLAKRWHPDRLDPQLGEVRDVAVRVFSRMSEAHAVLCDAERRRDYDELVKAGGGAADEQAEVQAVLRAATNFQKAEVLLKKNALVQAEEHAELAVEEDPKQSDYLALLAWIRSLKPERQGQPLDDLIEVLNQAVQMDRNNPRVRFYRGQLLKRAGKDRQAMRDFRFIVEENPRHLEATRELRLYEMRRAGRVSQAPPAPGEPRNSSNPPRRPGPEDKKGGLLNKLFKR